MYEQQVKILSCISLIYLVNHSQRFQSFSMFKFPKYSDRTFNSYFIIYIFIHSVVNLSLDFWYYSVWSCQVLNYSWCMHVQGIKKRHWFCSYRNACAIAKDRLDSMANYPQVHTYRVYCTTSVCLPSSRVLLITLMCSKGAFLHF